MGHAIIPLRPSSSPKKYDQNRSTPPIAPSGRGQQKLQKYITNQIIITTNYFTQSRIKPSSTTHLAIYGRSPRHKSTNNQQSKHRPTAHKHRPSPTLID